jgi:hypothetical protein
LRSGFQTNNKEAHMNNDLYTWHGQVMVDLEMDGIRKEIDSIRLLNDAGLTNPGLIERTAIAVGRTLVKLGDRLHKNYTEPHQAYEVTSGKYAA